jgi:hypothetical protein
MGERDAAADGGEHEAEDHAEDVAEMNGAAPPPQRSQEPAANERELCSDDACVGVIDERGRCPICGRPGRKAQLGAAGDAGAAGALGALEPARPRDLPCSLCSAMVAAGTGAFASGRRVCDSCAEQIEGELREQSQLGARLLPAAVLGLAGAAVGALVWAVITIATNFEVGYVAVLVGFLAGYGVKRGAGRARVPLLRAVAVACAVIGLVLAKYIIVAHLAITAARGDGLDVSYFDLRIPRIFWNVMPSMLSLFDGLWLILAVGAAARQLKPAEITLTR